jgi:hypothetical protein
MGRLEIKEDNVMTDLKKVMCEGTDWIYLAQDWSRGCLMRIRR